MKLINLLIIALSAVASADENKAAAATNLLRGTFNSAFQDIMSSGNCVAPNHSCNPDAASGSAAACCSGQAAGGGSYSCNLKIVRGSDAGPNDPGHRSYKCEENGYEDIVEEEDIMSTLSCAHGTGSREFNDQCGNNEQCASCCCYSQGGGPSEGSDTGPREREAHAGKTCKPTGWCNGFLDEDTAVDVVAAVEEEAEEDVEEEEEDFAALSCVAPGDTGCNPGSGRYGCCTGPSAGGPHVCNCVWNSEGSDAGPQEAHKVCTCVGNGDEEEFPFVAAASS